MNVASSQFQYPFDQIWTQFPARQNQHASTWWFILLAPKGRDGYGPRQMMFTVATRADKQVRINDTWLPAMDLARRVEGGVDRFPAIAVGWYNDGQTVHEGVLHDVATAALSSSEQALRCWTDDSETAYGCEFRAAPGPAPGLEVTVRGHGLAAHFTSWGDLDSEYTSPALIDDSPNPLGNVNFIAWRRMHFAGEFDLPEGREHLEGLAYFQRICMNMPLIPWKWFWGVFPDGTIFSTFLPYVGLNLTRREYRFFSRDWLEQTVVPIRKTGYMKGPGAAPPIHFDRVTADPIVAGRAHPEFLVTARNGRGDWLSFRTESHGHAGFGVHRPVAGPLQTHWAYNEYMYRMVDLNGMVSGQPVNSATMGQGYGNVEYTWGVGL